MQNQFVQGLPRLGVARGDGIVAALSDRAGGQGQAVKTCAVVGFDGVELVEGGFGTGQLPGPGRLDGLGGQVLQLYAGGGDQLTGEDADV